jgi:hypothetical protein
VLISCQPRFGRAFNWWWLIPARLVAEPTCKQPSVVGLHPHQHRPWAITGSTHYCTGRLWRKLAPKPSMMCKTSNMLNIHCAAHAQHAVTILIMLPTQPAIAVKHMHSMPHLSLPAGAAQPRLSAGSPRLSQHHMQNSMFLCRLPGTCPACCYLTCKCCPATSLSCRPSLVATKPK